MYQVNVHFQKAPFDQEEFYNWLWITLLLNIFSPLDDFVKTRLYYETLCAFQVFVSLQEPKNIPKALKDLDWVNAMQEELQEFKRNKV